MHANRSASKIKITIVKYKTSLKELINSINIILKAQYSQMSSYHKDQSILPNLFIAGFQKCGSSTLFDLLCQHPEIKGVKPKETFAITDKNYENFNPEKSVLNPDFSWEAFIPFETQKTYLLEASVCNFYQETAMDYISRLPDSKVLFIVRNPLERFLSTFNYFGGSGIFLKPGITISEFFKMVVSNHADLKKEPLKNAIEHGKYSVYINKWENLLGSDKIFVVGFGQLIRNPLDTLNKIYSFLGLSTIDSIHLVHKNKSTVARFPGLNRFISARFGGGKFKFPYLKSLYRKLIKKDAKKITMPEVLNAELKRIYSTEIKKFENIF